MKLTKKKEREYIIKMLQSILKANVEIMEFYKAIAKDRKSKNICEKSIRQSKLGMSTVSQIKHIEILRSLFNKIISGKEQYFAMVGAMCSYDKISVWDNTKTGFQEFLKLEYEEQKLREKETKERQDQQELIRQAQEQGKNIEMVYDPNTKKVKPVIVEEKPNA